MRDGAAAVAGIFQQIRTGTGRAAAALFDLVYPPHCGACEQPLPADASIPGLCDACLTELRLLDSGACRRCAHPLGHFTEDLAGTRCPQCSTLSLAFRRAWAACSYVGPIQSLIRQHKYSRRIAITRSLQALLIRRMRVAFGHEAAAPLTLPDDVLARSDPPEPAAPDPVPAAPDVIVPVPLHAGRRRARGFNQAELLARGLARALDLALDVNRLARTRPTEEQAGKTRAARVRALEGAFALRDPAGLKGKTVLLVDDVMTTGATVNACARALRAMDAPPDTPGAREVWVAVVARVPPPR